jgi:hypothetical protein
MTDRLMSLFAFGLLVGFLGILVWFVPRLDLAAVCLVTLAFAAYDFFAFGPSLRKRR